MHFTVLGGDLRSAYLVHRLLRDRHPVLTYGLELTDIPDYCRCDSPGDAMANTSCVVLPIPAADGTLLRAPYGSAPIELDALAELLPPNIPVFGGGRCPLPMTDLTAIETMAIGNAALTAQAALLLLLQHTRRSLMGQRVLMLGAGRIGTLLGLRLQSLGASVMAAARSPTQRAWCAAMGMDTADMRQLSHILPWADIIINTVPARILDREALLLTGQNTLLLELASLPGGFDPAEAEGMGRRTVIGRGLPGKYVPAGAADLIAETIYQELEL